MYFSDALLLISLGFSLAAPLGPINLEMLKQTLTRNKGWIFGLMTGFGAMTGDLIIAMTAMYLGSEVLEEAIEISFVKYSLLIINVIILSYISWEAWNAQLTEEIATETSYQEHHEQHEQFEQLEQIEIKRAISRQYSKGFILVMTSPWSYFWWISFGSYLLGRGLDLSSFTAKLLATFIFLSGIFCWLILFCFSLTLSRNMASAKTLNIITKISALAIIGITIKMVIDFIA